MTAWLDAIGEGDPAVRDEVLTVAARDPDARRYFIERAAQHGIVPDESHETMPADAPEVRCCDCASFRPDQINPVAGFGACRIGAPASRHPPSLWPRGKHHCRDWRPAR